MKRLYSKKRLGLVQLLMIIMVLVTLAACGEATSVGVGAVPTATLYPTTQPPTATVTTAITPGQTATPVPSTSATPVVINLSSPFELKAGQVGLLAAANFKIRFVQVTEDSRCPKVGDPPQVAACVWQGQVTTAFEVLNGEKVTDSFNLTKLAFGTSATPVASTKVVNGYTIKLMEVDPYPGSGKKTADSVYTATLVVTKN